MKKRVVSLLMLIVLVISVLPINVFAASGIISASPNIIPFVPGTSYVQTTIYWQTSGVTNVYIQVGGANYPVSNSGSKVFYINRTGIYSFGLYGTEPGYSFPSLLAISNVLVYEQKATISANPASVSIEYNQNSGTTRISGSTTCDKCYVSRTYNGVESFERYCWSSFWWDTTVYPGTTTFKIYDYTRGIIDKLLGSVTVTCTKKEPTGTISASPQTVTVPEGQLGSTTLTWTSTAPYVEVYVSENGEPEQLFALTGSNGSGTATWIQGGSNYVFNLYSYINDVKGKLLASVKVIGEKQQSSVAFDINSTSFNHLTDSFQLNVTSSPPLANQPVEIKIWRKIDGVYQVYSDLSTYGSTEGSGSFIMTGTFDSSLISDWKEQARIGSALSNEIYFTVY